MKLTALTFHCTATLNGKAVPVSQIRQWHRRRGFDDIGYHFLVCPDGTSHVGRSTEVQGAHVLGYNLMNGGINVGVALCGDTLFTLAQFERCRQILDWMIKDHGLPLNEVYGHREFSTAAGKKTCPNFRISDFLMWYVTGERFYIDKYLLKKQG